MLQKCEASILTYFHLRTRQWFTERLNPPQGWLFLLVARQSVQAPSALAPQRRFLSNFLPLKSYKNECLTDVRKYLKAIDFNLTPTPLNTSININSLNEKQFFH